MADPAAAPLTVEDKNGGIQVAHLHNSSNVSMKDEGEGLKNNDLASNTPSASMGNPKDSEGVISEGIDDKVSIDSIKETSSLGRKLSHDSASRQEVDLVAPSLMSANSTVKQASSEQQDDKRPPSADSIGDDDGDSALKNDDYDDRNDEFPSSRRNDNDTFGDDLSFSPSELEVDNVDLSSGYPIRSLDGDDPSMDMVSLYPNNKRSGSTYIVGSDFLGSKIKSFMSESPSARKVCVSQTKHHVNVMI